MNPKVAAAIDEIRKEFTDATVTAKDDGGGGAYVTVDGVPPGDQYEQEKTWVKFQITFQYPYADVYPHFVRPDLSRRDGQPLGEAMTSGVFGGDGQPAIQISRRSNRLDPSADTAALKLLKVLEWLRSR